jgi:DNA polymerase III delta prime subunit
MMNLLFYGSPGVGKTSAARILLKKIKAVVVPINGSLDNGVDVFREINPRSAMLPIFEGPRVFFIDEADFLSKNAQAAMRGFVEEASDSRFLLTANDINKMHPALKSRCMPICFDISAADADEVIHRIAPRLGQVIADAGFEITYARLRELLYIYFPDIRAVATRVEFEALRGAA